LDGFFNELREREHFSSKGEKRRHAKAASIRRCKKEQKKRKEELGF
jgi:ribosomal protein S21